MDDEGSIVELISQELSKLSENNVNPESETFSEDEISDWNEISHEIPDSVLSCFQLERDRLNSIECLIEGDPERKGSVKDHVVAVIPNSHEDLLKELASECGEDIITLQKRIISEIDEVEKQSISCLEDPPSAAVETEFMPHDNEDADEYEETERLCRAELRNLEMRLRAEQEKSMAEHELMKERFEKARQEAEEIRMRRDTFFEEELRRIECDEKVQQHFELDTEDNKTNDRMAQEFSKHQELITSLQKCISEERQAFEEAWAEPGRKTEEKQSTAAAEIRACMQAFLERTENAAVLGVRREGRRLRKEAQLLAERERKDKEENIQKMLKELEDQRIRWQEERRRKEEERISEKENKRQEEERLRLVEKEKREEEERLRLEEEKKREEERIRREEKEKREEEERRLRHEEEREREAERIRLEMERRRQEEERIRQEEEKRRQENVRRQEVERIKQEEEKRQEEERRRREEERTRQEEEKRRVEEERKKKEEEDWREREKVKIEARNQKLKDEARKRKEEVIRKQEQLEGLQRIAEEEHQLKEIENRKADELRKRVEEERIRNQQLERGSKERRQEGEVLIPGVKEYSQPEIVHPSISILYSEELDRGKQRPGSSDVLSGQPEEKHDNWRLRCSYQTCQSSVGCSSNETLSSINGGDEPCQQQGEAAPSLSSSDDPAADISEGPDSVEQEYVKWVKDFIPSAKPSPKSKRKAVLNPTVVNKGSVKPLPPPASNSIFQSASWDSQSQDLTVGQLDHSAEDSRKDEQKWLAELKEIRARHRASLVCEINGMTECSKRKEQQLHMEKGRMEREDRARKEEVEHRRKKETVEQERCATEEAEREHVEMVRSREVQEERQLALTVERESREPDEQVMSLRKTDGSPEEKERFPKYQPNPLDSNVKGEKEATPKEERFPEDQPNPPGSNVKGVNEATPNSDLQPGDLAKTEGSEAEISEVVTEIDDVKGQSTFSSLMCLPDSAERKRLQWMKECVPWTKLSMLNKRKQGVRGRSARRSPVKALPPLHAETILQTTACNSLKQVTTVTLEDLPGCSLSTLSECTKLQALTLRRCGLLALEGLGGCRDLRYIDVQENNITFLNCKDLTKLQVVLLSRNQLTSIHGLGDAASLGILELSYNCISSFSGLESQKQLQRLLMDHNQIISTRGLSELYTLLHLDCGYNHLTDMSGIENCALLRTLKVQGNSLTKPPSLQNHVLMTELYLDDNIISSLDCLSACWLPQLQLISVSKNCITHLSPLSDCVFLQRLDISDNCLSELPNVCHSLKGCTLLQEINLSGNPFQQESNWRSSLLQTVPGLQRIDGKWVSSTVPPTGWAGSPPPGSFMAFCRAQLLQLERAQSRHEAQLCTSCTLGVPTIISQHCEELLLLAEEQRNAHEFGDLTVVDHAEPATTGPYLDQHVLPVDPVEESAQDADTVSSCSLEPEGNGTTPSSVLEPSSGSREVNAGSHNADATRGHCTDQLEKHTEDKPTKKFSRNFVAQATISEEASQAATVIQAAWRGYVLRKRLASALTAVRVTEIDDEFPEVNLDEFEFDEAAFDSDWITLDLENSHPKTLPSCEQPLRPKSTQWSGSSAPPWQPRLGWLGEESERAASSGRRSLSPEMTGLTHRTKSPLPCLLGLRKEKSEKIMKEWGLRDMNTAELMLKRAQKMKPKKKKDRRLRDPGACLDLCRDNESRLAPLKIPKRNQPEKNWPVKDCLAAGEADLDEQKRMRRERTDLWLQAQASYAETDRTSPATESDCFLPEIDAKILSGRRVQLMSVSALPRCCQPGQGQRDGLDQESESRASVAALSLPRKEHNQTRANAVGHAKGETPALMPATIGTTKRNERISFRDNPVQHSLGWGGGKKRSKLTK